MKTTLARKTESALTLIEVLIILAIIAMLYTMMPIATNRDKQRAKRISCVMNLNQIGLSFHQWALDHNGAYPMIVSTAQGGASEYVDSPADTWRIFGCESNVLIGRMSDVSITPKILFCPAESDSGRVEATSFVTRAETDGRITYSGNTNLSYFIGVDAEGTQPGMLIAGDHNLGDNDDSSSDGHASTDYSATASTSLQALGTNVTSIRADWTDGNHVHQGDGVLSDGSVQQLTNTRLRNDMAHSGDPGRTNVLGNWQGAPPWQNRLQFPSLP